MRSHAFPASGLFVLLAALLLGGTPHPAAAQGWIERPADPTTPLRAWQVVRTHSEVEARVEAVAGGRVVRVEVTEWFRNEGGAVAEGHYLYPLPGEAVFQGFSLFQGETELRGEVMDAGEARRIYEEIVRRNADPALLELAGHGLLRARVFPIAAGEERKVTLRYTQVLERAGDALQMVYAGAVRGTPRGPGMRPTGTPRGEVPGAVHFRLLAQEGAGFLEPFSPTHDLSVRRGAGQLEVTVEGSVEERLSLFLPLAVAEVGLSLSTHRRPGEDGYFLLTLSPGRSPEPAMPRDLTVVLDVSGSMSGGKLRQAQAALRQLLETLGPDDRFRLLTFSNAVRREAEGWSAATPEARRRATRWIDGLVAEGGTNLEGALHSAFEAATPQERLPVVLFLTDGLPSVGEEDPERLAARAEADAGRARVFAFGVGHDVDTRLLDRLGQAGRGATQYVEPGEDVERAVGLLAMKVRHPVLTDLTVAESPVRLTEIHPVRLPDLFAGEELLLFGRYTGGDEGPLTVEGRRSGETLRYRTAAAFPRTEEGNAWMPRLWAARKLGHLNRQLWVEGRTESLVEAIRELALRYGLPSEFTSYLVTEPEAAMAQGDVATHGAEAVARAESARRLRDAQNGMALSVAEEVFRQRVEAPAPSGADGDSVASRPETRLVGGRVFQRQDGRWEDRSREAAEEVRTVRRFSSAWFDLVTALPELAPVLQELEEVRLAGAEVDLAVGPEGQETLDDDELRRLVRAFRGI